MYWRSMNGMRSSSRTHSFLMKTLILASHASSAPFVPFERILFFLSGHLYKISQQSHKGPPRRPSATLAPTVWAILSLKTLLLKEILGAG